MDLTLQIIYECIALNGMSIRETASVAGVSKSMVHYLIHHRLRDESYGKYMKVVKVLEKNKLYRSGRPRRRV